MKQRRTTADLLGRPLRDLRISVTDTCNFRCTYCMPSEVFGEAYSFVDESRLISFDEITRLTRIFARLGVRKIKITGGEPLLRPWLDTLIKSLCSIEGIEDVALITNGYHLAGMASRLRRAGLDRVTVSLDSLNDKTFGAMNGRGYRLERVLSGIRAARDAGFTPIKINTVIERGVNDGEVVELARRFRGEAFQLRFIEYMDVGTLNGWQRDRVVSSEEIRDRIDREFSLTPIAGSYRGEVAERYRYVDGGGEIGFISSITNPFCGDCTRARLSADGVFYSCLFASRGNDLLNSLRSGRTDEDILAEITAIWGQRSDRYSELRADTQVEDGADRPYDSAGAGSVEERGVGVGDSVSEIANGESVAPKVPTTQQKRVQMFRIGG